MSSGLDPGRTSVRLISGFAGMTCAALTLLSCVEDKPATVSDAVPEMVLTPDPLWMVGVRDGLPEQTFYRISGAVRLADGSVVVGVAGMHEVRKYGPDRSHLWTRGGVGEGPGEFQSLELVAGCGDETIMIWDPRLQRVTEFTDDGRVADTWLVTYEDDLPPYRVVCTAGGRLVYHPWGNVPPETEGPFRWSVPVAWTDGTETQVLQEGVPGPERVVSDASYHERPWGHTLALAATDHGVWIGTGDDYEVLFVDWNGAVSDTVRWTGPDRSVTQSQVDRLYDTQLTQLARLADQEAVDRFRTAVWPEILSELPSTLPAYSRLLMSRADELWVGLWSDVDMYRELSERGRTWYAFDAAGRVARRLTVDPNMRVQDMGADWVVVSLTDQVGVEKLAVYALEEAGD